MATREQDAHEPLVVTAVGVTAFRGLTRRAALVGQGGERLSLLVGASASGKSTLLAALELFFRAAPACLAHALTSSERSPARVPFDVVSEVGKRDVLVRRRDLPDGAQAAAEIVVRLGAQKPFTLRLSLTAVQPRCELVELRLTRDDDAGERALAELLSSLTEPFGPGSRPFARLTSSRRASWLPDEPPAPMPPGLSRELFRLATSLSVGERGRFRSFVDLLSRFAPFDGRQVSVERAADGLPQLVIEQRGKAIVPFSELSSGEQQIAVLCATLLMARAPLVAIEQPEAGLDDRSRKLFAEVVEGVLSAGLVEQVLVETALPQLFKGHVVSLDAQPRAAPPAAAASPPATTQPPPQAPPPQAPRALQPVAAQQGPRPAVPVASRPQQHEREVR